jgi:hypothetical protein
MQPLHHYEVRLEAQQSLQEIVGSWPPHSIKLSEMWRSNHNDLDCGGCARRRLLGGKDTRRPGDCQGQPQGEQA